MRPLLLSPALTAAAMVPPVVIISSTRRIGRPRTSPTIPFASTSSPLRRVLLTTAIGMWSIRAYRSASFTAPRSGATMTDSAGTPEAAACAKMGIALRCSKWKREKPFERGAVKVKRHHALYFDSS